MSMSMPAGGLGLPAEFRVNPYPYYEQLRARDPVLWAPGVLGRGAWLITSHRECSAVLKDSRFGKEADKVLSPEEMAHGPGLIRRVSLPNMLFRDPPTHTRLRGLVNQAFTPRMLERLRPHIQEIAESLAAGLAGKAEVDLISEVAFPLPIIVIAELLGVPASDRAQFKAWSNPLAATTDPTATPEMVDEAMKVIPVFTAYMKEIIAERRKHLGADLISSLIEARDAGDKLSEEELLAACRLLLVAGHETTVNLIGNGTLALLRNPEQRQWLGAHPDQIVNAVEELLRYDSPVQLTMRITFEDVDVAGHTIKRGDQVVTLLGAANRDPEVFADPAVLDLTRANAHSHVAFGQGIHYCLGAPLARMEGQIAIGALVRHFPDMALTGAELKYRGNITLRGLQELPVRLG